LTDTTATRVTGIINIAVPVSDHERALAFYTGTLGFEVRRDATFGPGMRWVEVAPPGAATTIALAPPGEIKPGIETGIRVGTPDATRTHSELRAAGANVDAEIMRFGGPVPPMFYVRDPDGNRIVIVETA